MVLWTDFGVGSNIWYYIVVSNGFITAGKSLSNKHLAHICSEHVAGQRNVGQVLYKRWIVNIP